MFHQKVNLIKLISIYFAHRKHEQIKTSKNRMLSTRIGRFQITAFLEGVSFLLILVVTMPLKYLYDMPEPNQVIGMAHGILFVLYVFQSIALTIENKWSFKTLFILFVASILPFGTFYFVPRVLRAHAEQPE